MQITVNQFLAKLYKYSSKNLINIFISRFLIMSYSVLTQKSIEIYERKQIEAQKKQLNESSNENFFLQNLHIILCKNYPKK